MKKELLACSKNELCAAVYALQYAIRKFHGRRLPQSREIFIEIGQEYIDFAAPVSLSSFVLNFKGPGPPKRAAENLEGERVRTDVGGTRPELPHARSESDSGEINERNLRRLSQSVVGSFPLPASLRGVLDVPSQSGLFLVKVSPALYEPSYDSASAQALP